MMAIELVGGVYCPLSPRDPEHRLHSLLKQTNSRLVLVHSLTITRFNVDIVLLNIDSILTNKDVSSDVNIDQLSDVVVIPDHVAYIIFTSGSTGIPKAVSIIELILDRDDINIRFVLGSSSTSKLHSMYAFFD
jgi:non-ribosomal peptide synthetase component F